MRLLKLATTAASVSQPTQFHTSKHEFGHKIVLAHSHVTTNIRNTSSNPGYSRFRPCLQVGNPGARMGSLDLGSKKQNMVKIPAKRTNCDLRNIVLIHILFSFALDIKKFRITAFSDEFFCNGVCRYCR